MLLAPSLRALLLSAIFAVLATLSVSRFGPLFNLSKRIPLASRFFSSPLSQTPEPLFAPMSSTGHPTLAELEAFWAKAFDELPSTHDNIPAFFFGHGSPVLAFPKDQAAQMGEFAAYQGANGPTGKFLSVFGPMLLKKYKPKAIVVFSAHWETPRERLVTDYVENPLLMDYYGFPPALYQLKFKSKGDRTLAERIVDLYKKAGHRARLSPTTEARGEDGRGFMGPGLDHGVFVPFRIMFGEEFTDIPIVQVSIDASLDPESNWQVGKAVADLRKEGVLVLSGGLTAHNLGDRVSFSPVTARQVHREFDAAIHAAIQVEEAETRKQAMFGLTKLPSFRASQPREDHFVPLYVAAGAGEGGKVRTLNPAYGIPTFAFGI